MENYYGFDSNEQYIDVAGAVRSITGLEMWDFKVYYHELGDDEFEGCIEVIIGGTVHIIFYNNVLDIKCTTSFNMRTVELITKISDNIGAIWEAYRNA